MPQRGAEFPGYFVTVHRPAGRSEGVGRPRSDIRVIRAIRSSFPLYDIPAFSSAEFRNRPCEKGDYWAEPTYGKRAMNRARLMASVIMRCSNAAAPMRVRG